MYGKHIKIYWSISELKPMCMITFTHLEASFVLQAGIYALTLEIAILQLSCIIYNRDQSCCYHRKALKRINKISASIASSDLRLSITQNLAECDSPLRRRI